MKELLLLVRETIVRAFEIATFRSVGADLPNARGFAMAVSVLSAAFVAGEQLARGHGIAGMIIIPAVWLFVIWTVSRVEGQIDYRIASALLLGSIPVCVILVLVAGSEPMEWIVSAWGAVVMLNVLAKQHKQWM
ncbi:hypothetical protein [Sulfuricystis multivorans]|uniref:hypothetical protein n=1 Tax=Sulfuricystis multivorans TaxID=2211108 RepID=UPI000F8339D3|nr:hypothetical protein [Sulfuricystis multivorans]